MPLSRKPLGIRYSSTHQLTATNSANRLDKLTSLNEALLISKPRQRPLHCFHKIIRRIPNYTTFPCGLHGFDKETSIQYNRVSVTETVHSANPSSINNNYIYSIS
jgi:hypothetical protein